ncbi:MAG: 2-hydroxyacyl-CoA dehydratase subunit D [Chloroflexota bacterium]
MALFDVLKEMVLSDLAPGLITPALRLELLHLRLDHARKRPVRDPRTGLFPSGEWRSQWVLQEAGLRLTIRAYQRRDGVVYTSLLLPPEPFHALGLIPFSLESAGAGAAALGLTARLLAVAEKRWAPADACSVLRMALGVAELGVLPKPLAVVCTSCVCDSTPKVFAAAAEASGGAPFAMLDVPYEDSPDAVAYLAEQYRALVEQLETLAGRRLDPAHLAEALALSNRARTHMLALNDLRRLHPGLLPAEEAMAFLYPTSVLLGSKDGVAVFRAFREEVAARAGEHADGRRPRLLWLHLLPYYRHELLDTIEALGAVVVFEEISQVYWPELDPSRPYEGLARRCISHFWNGPLERRIEGLVKMAREHKVDGAVHFSHHGCRQSWGALQAVREALLAEGVPLLDLEGDLVDPRGQAAGQHRTRLEAFVETLR